MFEAGAYDHGRHALFRPPRESQLGRGEPIKDMARELSRMTDGIMTRAYAHAGAEELGLYADVPVINGFTDVSHPCQILADGLTVRHFLGSCHGRRITWIGDGHHMAYSWIEAAQRLGFSLRLACLEGYDSDPVMIATTRAKGADATLVRDPRVRKVEGFKVGDALMARTAVGAICEHCLPAHRGEGVSASVLERPQRRVWAEAENRLHIRLNGVECLPSN